MTFAEVLLAFMEGQPITRKAWIDDDENKMVYYDFYTKTFVERRTAETWELQCKFTCFTYEDMAATDWEVCDWEDEEDKEVAE